MKVYGLVQKSDGWFVVVEGGPYDTRDGHEHRRQPELKQVDVLTALIISTKLPPSAIKVIGWDTFNYLLEGVEIDL